MKSTTTRRKFFGGAAVLAAPLAATAAVASHDLAARLAALEDLNAIRSLLQSYAQRVNAGTDAAPAANVRSVTLDSDGAIDVAANGTASARVGCTVETAMPIDGRDTLVEMARLQGDGVVKRSERRVLVSAFVKRGGIWTVEHTGLKA